MLIPPYGLRHPKLVSGSKEMLKRVWDDGLNNTLPQSLPRVMETEKFSSPFRLHSTLIRKVAFTLAEVLITLGIIGVVAALTLPALINKTNKKELEVALKKTYSELNQASMMFYNNEGVSFPEQSLRSYSSSVDTFMKYFQGGQKYLDANHANKNEIPGYTIYSPNKKENYSRLVCDVSGYYIDNIGRIFSFNDKVESGSENGPAICVDINGQKKPNRYGYDVFVFLFTVDGRIIPMGQEHKNNPANTNLTHNGFVSGEEYCNYTGDTVSAGYACAYYAISDTHPTEKGKTYWKDFLR